MPKRRFRKLRLSRYARGQYLDNFPPWQGADFDSAVLSSNCSSISKSILSGCAKRMHPLPIREPGRAPRNSSSTSFFGTYSAMY